MKLIFGLELDGQAYPGTPINAAGILKVGPNSLLNLLETHLGLSGHPNNEEYLRIEAFRQACLHLLEKDQPFFLRSFQADPFATAANLLERRDELLLAGWDFNISENIPNRLQTIAQLEDLFRSGIFQLPVGFADRVTFLKTALKNHQHPFEAIELVEPFELLPYYLQDLFKLLKNPDCQIIEPVSKAIDHPISDLELFQAHLLRQNPGSSKQPLKGDGSLLLFEAHRSTDAAQFVAALLRKNPDFKPLCLIPEKFPALDNAFIQEGLPSLGIQTSSLARPSLQLLKLTPAFLWQPMDPYKVLEFVNLTVKPIDDGLANLIANQIARRPGTHGEDWKKAIQRYINFKGNQGKKIEAQYEFWFERKRYSPDSQVPKIEILELFNHLQEWAKLLYEDHKDGTFQSLRVLSEQAKRICEMLLALPETELSRLQIERIVRTIYEPAAVLLQEAEVGHVPFIQRAGAIHGPAKATLWWNFIQNEPTFFFSKWYKNEIAYLQKFKHKLEPPERENQRALWHRIQPILQTQAQLLFFIPSSVNGEAVNPNPLYGDLEAGFSNLEKIRFSVDQQATLQPLKAYFKLPDFVQLPLQQLGQPAPFIEINRLKSNFQRPEETYSSLRDLFYYPYQWVFRHRILLKKSSLLSVVPDETLMGNLAHHLFELLLQQDAVLEWDKIDLENWIDQEMKHLFEKEGAVLLLYGREPERIGFLNRIKFAAWSLLHSIRENGWKIQAIETKLQGKISDLQIKGIADLVLAKGEEKAIIDLKWRGAGWRQRLLKNEEDIQLILYSNMLPTENHWPHTAFFIINQGKLIARNNVAFEQAIAVSPEADVEEVNQRIWEKMVKTLEWRRAQLKNGQIEVRAEKTAALLEDHYAELDHIDLLELLEMKDSNAPYDDYKVLINLIE